MHTVKLTKTKQKKIKNTYNLMQTTQYKKKNKDVRPDPILLCTNLGEHNDFSSSLQNVNQVVPCMLIVTHTKSLWHFAQPENYAVLWEAVELLHTLSDEEFFEFNLSQKEGVYDKWCGPRHSNPSHIGIFGQYEERILVVLQAVELLPSIFESSR